MIIQILRMVNTWLEDGTYGVNAQLDLLTTDSLLGSDTQPPDIAFIGNPADDELVAEWKAPNKLPAIYVTIGGPATADGEVHTVQRLVGDLRVDILYLAQLAQTHLLFRNTGHTLRAIARSLKVFNDNAQDADRTQHGILMKTCKSMIWTPWVEAVGDARATGLVQCVYNLVDQNP